MGATLGIHRILIRATLVSNTQGSRKTAILLPRAVAFPLPGLRRSAMQDEPSSKRPKLFPTSVEPSAAATEAVTKSQSNLPLAPLALSADALVLAERALDFFGGPFGGYGYLSAGERNEKKVQCVMDAAKCSRAEAQQLVEQRLKREAQEEAAAEAKALSAMAARSQESGKVWAVELDPYNKYCATKPKLLSTHRSEQEATRRAKGWWANDTFGVDNLTMLSAEGEPYSANACIEIGGGVMTVSVIQVDISDLKGSMLKKALQLRGAPVSGSAQELRDRLKALVDSERT